MRCAAANDHPKLAIGPDIAAAVSKSTVGHFVSKPAIASIPSAVRQTWRSPAGSVSDSFRRCETVAIDCVPKYRRKLCLPSARNRQMPHHWEPYVSLAAWQPPAVRRLTIMPVVARIGRVRSELRVSVLGQPEGLNSNATLDSRRDR